MFERYTEKARRVIFFARYEASRYGSPYIETEHLLLGLIRELKWLTTRLLPEGSEESIRAQIAAGTPHRESTSTAIDLPLTGRASEFSRTEQKRRNASLINISEASICFSDCFATRNASPRGCYASGAWRYRNCSWNLQRQSKAPGRKRTTAFRPEVRWPLFTIRSKSTVLHGMPAMSAKPSSDAANIRGTGTNAHGVREIS